MTIEAVTIVQFDPEIGPANDGTLDRVCDIISRSHRV